VSPITGYRTTACGKKNPRSRLGLLPSGRGGRGPFLFGTTVARNRGLQFDTFASEAEAPAWLLDPQTDSPD
jgi:hypothetical protein